MFLPAIEMVTAASFIFVSVVNMASAMFLDPVILNPFTSWEADFWIFLNGKGFPMIPVDATITFSFGILSNFPMIAVVRSA